MKYLTYICFALLVASMAGCTEDKYEISIPETGITLAMPMESDTLDLNEEALSRCAFTCNTIAQGGNTLVLSSSPLLKDVAPIQTVTVDMGESNSIEIDVLDIDMYFGSLGVGGGRAGTIYWTVKPTKQLTAAATEIRALNVKRVKSQLIAPDDQEAFVLNYATSEATIAFSWNAANGNSYDICFSTDSKMAKDVVKIDGGTDGHCYLTHMQLQDMLEQLPINKYSQSNIYWNVARKTDGNFVSRSSNIVKFNDMMIFTDRRGDEVNIYPVTRITFADGTQQIWTAENLRATRFPDGTPMSPDTDYRNAPTDVDEATQRAYGKYYPLKGRERIVPEGWRLPTYEECKNLVIDSRLTLGTADVLKHPQYWAWSPSDYANLWGLGLVSSGRYNYDNGGYDMYNGKGEACCYLLTSDLDSEAANFSAWGLDNEGTVYHSWVNELTCCGARLIFVGN